MNVSTATLVAEQDVAARIRAAADAEAIACAAEAEKKAFRQLGQLGAVVDSIVGAVVEQTEERFPFLTADGSQPVVSINPESVEFLIKPGSHRDPEGVLLNGTVNAGGVVLDILAHYRVNPVSGKEITEVRFLTKRKVPYAEPCEVAVKVKGRFGRTKTVMQTKVVEGTREISVEVYGATSLAEALGL